MPDRNAKPDIARSEQGVLNRSFDETYQVLAVEQLEFNPTTNTLDRKQVGFGAGANVSTEIVTVGSVKTITQTDGTKTCTITIDATDPLDKLITKVWS